MKFFDTHCHLNDDAYREDLEEVVGRARQEGVAYLLVPGYDLPSSVQAVELAGSTRVYAAVGVHPMMPSPITRRWKRNSCGFWPTKSGGCR